MVYFTARKNCQSIFSGMRSGGLYVGLLFKVKIYSKNPVLKMNETYEQTPLCLKKI